MEKLDLYENGPVKVAMIHEACERYHLKVIKVKNTELNLGKTPAIAMAEIINKIIEEGKS